MTSTYYSEISSLRDVDVGVLVAHKVDVGHGEVLAGELPPRVAGLVVPLELAVLQLGGACSALENYQDPDSDYQPR